MAGRERMFTRVLPASQIRQDRFRNPAEAQAAALDDFDDDPQVKDRF
jgi:hypothetical protein